MTTFMFFGLVALALIIGNFQNVSATCICCQEVLDMFKVINKKLDLILKGSPPSPGPVCKSLNRQAVDVNATKKVISVGRAFGAIANGNEVYITGYYDKHVYRFDQTGVLKERVRSPTGKPTFLDIHGGKLYMTDFRGNSVYTRPLSGNQGFTKLLSQHLPVGIKVSPNGDRIFVSEWNTGRVNVYNKALQRIRTLSGIATYPREIFIDSAGNIHIASYTNTIFIYNKNLQFIGKQVIQGATHIDGFYVHCDGTRVFADRSGKLIFADRKGTLLRIVHGFKSTGDVAVTSDGTMFVTDIEASRVYLFSVY